MTVLRICRSRLAGAGIRGRLAGERRAISAATAGCPAPASGGPPSPLAAGSAPLPEVLP